MALAQDYWHIASSRFGRAQLTDKVGATYVPMTRPVYFAAAGMSATTSTALAVVGANQPTGLEYRLAVSSRFDRMQLNRGTAPYMPTPLYFGNSPGPLYSQLANAILAGLGQETSVGTLATTLADAILAASGQVLDSGTLATILADAVLAATGQESESGTFATILDDAVLAALGEETSLGTLATTLADAVLAATGNPLAVTGVLATTLANAVLAGVGADTGYLTTILANAVLASVGTPVVDSTMNEFLWSSLVNLVSNGMTWDLATATCAMYSFGNAATRAKNIIDMNANRTLIATQAALPYTQRAEWYRRNDSAGLTWINWLRGT